MIIKVINRVRVKDKKELWKHRKGCFNQENIFEIARGKGIGRVWGGERGTGELTRGSVGKTIIGLGEKMEKHRQKCRFQIKSSLSNY